MPNVLRNYDEIDYAQAALVFLKKSLGLAGTVLREGDLGVQRRGSTVSVKRPGSFAAVDMPSTAQDINPDEVSITLDQWKGVELAANDRELAFAKSRYIDDHIAPAAYAVADAIELSLFNGPVLGIPYVVAGTATPTNASEIIAARKLLFDNKAPRTSPDFYAALSSDREAQYLGLSLFTSDQGSGAAGVNTQLGGFLGRRFGFQFWATQNAPVLPAAGTLTGSPTVTALTPKGATSITLGAGSLTGTVTKGATLAFAGFGFRIAVAANATAAGNSITLQLAEPLPVAIPATTAVTVTQYGSVTVSTFYHKNFAALAMATLDEGGDGLGAMVGTATDPDSGLAIRYTRWYDGNTATQKARLDALWGVKLLDGNLGVRVHV